MVLAVQCHLIMINKCAKFQSIGFSLGEKWTLTKNLIQVHANTNNTVVMTIALTSSRPVYHVVQYVIIAILEGQKIEDNFISASISKKHGAVYAANKAFIFDVLFGMILRFIFFPNTSINNLGIHILTVLRQTDIFVFSYMLTKIAMYKCLGKLHP